MNSRVKLAAAAAGALLVAGAVVVATVAATNAYRSNGSSHPATQPATAASPGAQAAPGKRGQANPAHKAVRQAVLEAEAQVLGLQPKDLAADLKQGKTVHQLADQKGLSQAAFQAEFSKDLTGILDQDVQKGTLSSQQEQQALNRVRSTVPNWDQAGKPRTK